MNPVFSLQINEKPGENSYKIAAIIALECTRKCNQYEPEYTIGERICFNRCSQKFIQGYHQFYKAVEEKVN